MISSTNSPTLRHAETSPATGKSAATSAESSPSQATPETASAKRTRGGAPARSPAIKQEWSEIVLRQSEDAEHGPVSANARSGKLRNAIIGRPAARRPVHPAILEMAPRTHRPSWKQKQSQERRSTLAGSFTVIGSDREFLRVPQP